jgi:2-polyprenyl-6-methoxyphenol hydroxylase-like FAD-dependent oxidoreductase
VLRDLLEDAEPITTPAGRTGLARTARAGWAPGAVLLGDAAASTDPLTAGGLAHALVTAERLAAAVPAYLACAPDAAQADAALARFDRERKPLLARATLHVMRAVPPLMRSLVAVAAGTSIQAPKTVAASSSPALAINSATDQKAILPQRFGSP